MGYCERCGGKFDDEDLCEYCGDDEEWSWNTPYNTKKVKCKRCGHDIYEARRFCFVCGAKNPAAFKKGDAYCPRCGNAFENGICPNCGKTKAHFDSLKVEPEIEGFCKICGETVCYDDNFCMKCGTELYYNAPTRDAKLVGAGKTAKKAESTAKSYNDFDSDDGWESIGKEVNPNLWLILGIVSLIICCMPTSIGTIVCSIQAKKALERGKQRTAEKKVGAAIRWFFAGAVIILLLMAASVIIKVTN